MLPAFGNFREIYLNHASDETHPYLILHLPNHLISLAMSFRANFCVGQLVYHIKFDYRGVVVDVDAEYQGSEEWYREVARSQPPKDKPWYHVLVDRAAHMTYVAERHLIADDSCEPITHPAIDDFFDEFRDCSYHSRHSIN